MDDVTPVAGAARHAWRTLSRRAPCKAVSCLDCRQPPHRPCHTDRTGDPGDCHAGRPSQGEVDLLRLIPPGRAPDLGAVVGQVCAAGGQPPVKGHGLRCVGRGDGGAQQPCTQSVLSLRQAARCQGLCTALGVLKSGATRDSCMLTMYIT